MRRRTSLLTLVLTAALVLPAAAAQRGPRGIVVYEDADYRGHRESFNGPIRSLRDVGLNDRISSFEIPRGESWELCEDDDFRGRCQVFSGDVQDLARTGWNDRVSSMRPVGNGTYGSGGYGGYGNNGGYGNSGDRRGNDEYAGRRGGGYGGYGNGGYGGQQRGRLELFEDKRFDGKSIALEQPRNSLGSMDAKAESLRLSGVWEICDAPNFRGRCMVVDQDVPDLDRIGWKERIRSARPR